MMMFNFWNRRRWLVFIWVAATAVLVVWFGYQWYLGRVQSHAIVGLMWFDQASGLEILGTHILDKNPQNSDYQHQQVISVTVTADTKFLRLFPNIPPKPGSIDDFKNLSGLRGIVKTAANTISQATVTAAEIDYSFLIKQTPPKQ